MTVRGDIVHVPERTATLEAKLEEGDEVNADAGHQSRLVRQPAIRQHQECI